MHPAEQNKSAACQSIWCSNICCILEAARAELSAPDASAKDLGGHPDGHLVQSVAVILGGPALGTLLLCQADQVHLRSKQPTFQEAMDEQYCQSHGTQRC